MDARAASEEEESGSDDESETERFNAEDAFHECYVCGAYAGGDAIQLECSHLRPSFAQAANAEFQAGVPTGGLWSALDRPRTDRCPSICEYRIECGSMFTDLR